MSNSLAIAAVTATLRKILSDALTPDLPDTEVSAQPLDKARGARTTNQVNLFLYEVSFNGAWRNRDLPNRTHPGESAFPPLGLDLYYLITCFGRNDDDQFAHQLLGGAMSAVHDRPLLGAADSKAALPESDLHEQVERVRITPHHLSVEESSKLWTTFQTQYRISVAYQVSVVLIESRRTGRAPLPVLARGQDDSGVRSAPDLTPSFPALATVRTAHDPWGAESGEAVTLMGAHLSGAGARIRLNHPRLSAPVELAGPFAARSEQEITVPLPSGAAAPPAGVLTVAVGFPDANGALRWTNAAPLTLVPRIAVTPVTAASGALTLNLTVEPPIAAGQSVLILFGERPVTLPTPDAATTTLTVRVPDVGAGGYLIRLRVDGVDSLVTRMDPTNDDHRPAFDPARVVTVT